MKTTKNGEIVFLMKSGKDLVENSTLRENIERMIGQALTVERTDEHPDYPICVNGKFFFPELPKKAKEMTNMKPKATRKKKG